MKRSFSVGLVGCGNMGGAIARSLYLAGFDVNLIDYDSEKAKSFAAELNRLDGGNAAAIDSVDEITLKSDFLIFAVKPQVFGSVLPSYREDISQKLKNDSRFMVMSIGAGKTTLEIESYIGVSVPVVRVMPNLAAEVNQSMSGYCFNTALKDGALELFEGRTIEVLEAFGKAMHIDEDKFSIFSALAGCAPAFVLMFIDAMAQSAVKFGLNKKQSLEIADQVVKGAALYFESVMDRNDGHPRILIDNICSPGGTTIEGVSSLQNDAFEAVVSRAIEASYIKDKSFGK